MKKLGKYELVNELGRGAMGIVYRARDPIINRLVALKTITAGVSDYPNLLQRFYREAQSAGGLQHPNIVTIYDMGDESGTPYIAMELVEGQSLEQVIADVNAHRGEITKMISRGKQQMVEALLPLRLLFDYSDRIRSLTQGRASWTMEPHSYAPVPDEVLHAMLHPEESF